MHLSNFAVTKAKPKERPYKLSDGAGLHLLVETNGSKLWRFRYRFAGRENMLTFGPYPIVSLASARDKRTKRGVSWSPALIPRPSVSRRKPKSLQRPRTRSAPLLPS